MDKLPNGLFPVNHVSRMHSSPESYRDTGSFSRRSLKAAADYALAQLEEARKKDVEAHEANAPVIARHVEFRVRIVALMGEAGVPSHYTERDTKSRSRYPKSVRLDAGYIGDLHRSLPVSDGFEGATQTYERLKQAYLAFSIKAAEVQRQEDANRAREQEAAAERRKADLALAGMILRYQLPEDSTWDSALEALRTRDQRLDLAVAMSQTRCDWSDGAYRVHDAMKRFAIRTDEDKAIAVCIVERLEDFEDGRVFRDCEWNYGRLFASAGDPQLAADVQLALSNIER